VDVGKLLVLFLKPELDRSCFLTLAKVVTKKPPPPLPEVPVDLYYLKVSEPSSSCQCGVVGRNRAQFGAP
jgi:hypothetical protein